MACWPSAATHRLPDLCRHTVGVRGLPRQGVGARWLGGVGGSCVCNPEAVVPFAEVYAEVPIPDDRLRH